MRFARRRGIILTLMLVRRVAGETHFATKEMGNSTSSCFKFNNSPSTVQKEGKIKLISKPEFKHKRANQHTSATSHLTSAYTFVILGVAGAGKSCLFQHLANQCEFLLSSTCTNCNTLDAGKRKALKKQIIIQLVLEMKQTVEAMEQRQISTHYHSTRFYISYIKGYNTQFVKDWVPFHQHKVPIEVVKALSRLWKDPNVRSMHAECFEGTTNGSALFERLEELCQNDYIPTERDCLMLQLPSESVQAMELDWVEERTNHAVHLSIYNIDGRASQLTEWSNSFERANAVLFVHPVVGMSSQVEESLELFQAVCQSNWFAGLPILVVFSKWDLLLQREVANIDAKWMVAEKKRIQREFASTCKTHPLFSCWRTRGIDEPLDIAQLVSIFR